jgi:hypothetical protein
MKMDNKTIAAIIIAVGVGLIIVAQKFFGGM